MKPGLWSRVKRAQIVQVLVVYAGASWVILEITSVFIDEFGLPDWFFQAAIVLLLIGLVILGGTAWVQGSAAGSRASASVPTPWEVDLIDIKETVARGRLPHLTWGRAVLGGVVAFSLLFGFAGVLVLLNSPAAERRVTTSSAQPVAPGVAVLPFRVVGSEMEFWREGMVDLLATNLDGAAGLRALDPRNVLSHWRREFGESSDAPNRGAALAVASQSGASFAVIGSAVALSDRAIRLTAEVFDAGSHESLGRAQVEGATDSILSLVDDLSVEILRSRIVQEGTEIPQLDLRSLTTRSLPALRAYLEGEREYRLGRWRAARDLYGRALNEDSTFALALYRLDLVAGWGADPVMSGTEAGLRAAELGEDLPERVRLLLQGNAEFDLGDPSCIETFTRLVERYPDDVEGWYQLGESYLHIGAKHRHSPQRYRDALTRAVSLDPGYGPAYIHLIEDAMATGDSAAARRLLDRYLSLGSSGTYATSLPIAHALTWGGDSSRTAAKVAVDTASGDALVSGTFTVLQSPYTYEAARSFGEELLESERSPPLRARGHFILGAADVLRGRTRTAKDHFATMYSLNARIDSTSASARAELELYLFFSNDSASAGRAVDLLSRNDPGGPSPHFYLGAYAGREGNWEEFERRLETLNSGARSAASSGDGERRRRFEGLAWGLRVYGTVYRGDLDAAISQYEDWRPGLFTPESDLVVYELGRLAFSEGDFELASDIFTGLTYSRGPFVSLSELGLAEALEARGEREEARRHYARFLTWYNAPDPYFQPLQDRAQAALARLSQEPRS